MIQFIPNSDPILVTIFWCYLCDGLKAIIDHWEISRLRIVLWYFNYSSFLVVFYLSKSGTHFNHICGSWCHGIRLLFVFKPMRVGRRGPRARRGYRPGTRGAPSGPPSARSQGRRTHTLREKGRDLRVRYKTPSTHMCSIQHTARTTEPAPPPKKTPHFHVYHTSTSDPDSGSEFESREALFPRRQNSIYPLNFFLSAM